MTINIILQLKDKVPETRAHPKGCAFLGYGKSDKIYTMRERMIVEFYVARCYYIIT